MNEWINLYHGLELYPGFEQNTRDNENGILFLCEYYFLKYELNQISATDIQIFKTIANNLRTYKPDRFNRYEGLFDRGADESLMIPKDRLRTISHDNISAIASFSAMFQLDFHKKIYQHGIKNFWRFDNVYPDKPRWKRIMHPRDIIYWSRLGGSFIGKSLAWLFMWIFYITQIWSALDFYEKNGDIATSGPLLIYMRLMPLRTKWYNFGARFCWWLCKKIRKWKHRRNYDYMFEYYFKYENHPNRVLAKKVFT